MVGLSRWNFLQRTLLCYFFDTITAVIWWSKAWKTPTHNQIAIKLEITQRPKDTYGTYTMIYSTPSTNPILKKSNQSLIPSVNSYSKRLSHESLISDPISSSAKNNNPFFWGSRSPNRRKLMVEEKVKKGGKTGFRIKYATPTHFRVY